MRRCSKTGCQSPARATLTYNYADSQVVVGPLAQLAEPHIYDLCLEHAQRITAPRGWEVLRLELPAPGEEPAPATTAAPGTTAPVPPVPLSHTPASHTPAPPVPTSPSTRPGLRVVRAGE